MTTAELATTVVGVLGTLSGVGALVGVLINRRKLRADAADVLTDTALTLVEPLQKRVRQLEDRVEELEQALRRSAARERELERDLDTTRGELVRLQRLILDPRVSRDELIHQASTDTTT